MRRRHLLVLLPVAAALPLAAQGAPRVDLEAAREALARGEAVLIDIREPDEHALGVAPGARRLPLSQIGQRLDEVPSDRPVLLICRTQNRSSKLAEALHKRGYDQVRWVDGGMKGWQERGWPTVAPQ